MSGSNCVTRQIVFRAKRFVLEVGAQVEFGPQKLEGEWMEQIVLRGKIFYVVLF